MHKTDQQGGASEQNRSWHLYPGEDVNDAHSAVQSAVIPICARCGEAPRADTQRILPLRRIQRRKGRDVPSALRRNDLTVMIKLSANPALSTAWTGAGGVSKVT